MRTHLFRGVLAFAVVLLVSAVPALAQSIVRGKVVDAQGKPVPDATILFEAEGANRKTQTKTDKNGDFLQVGLQSGQYKVTASKQGVGTQTVPTRVTQGQNQPLNFTISAASGASATDKEAEAAIRAAATAATDAMRAGRHDEAIAKFNEVLAKVPNCYDCYSNLGVAFTAKQQYTEAENAYKKAIELKPDSAEAYTGLANLYNAQKKFDLAADASAKAAQYAGAAGGGAGAEASYNQGVILFNAGKFTDAKAQFESAAKTDPNMPLAHYFLGMSSLNVGDMATAVASFEKFLSLDPNGERIPSNQAVKVPELKAFLASQKK